MALDCECSKCTGREPTEDDIFEHCLNDYSNLQFKKMKATSSSEAGWIVFGFFSLIATILIFAAMV